MTAKDGGVFGFNNQLRVTLLNSLFKANQANRTGGAILATNQVLLTI